MIKEMDPVEQKSENERNPTLLNRRQKMIEESDSVEQESEKLKESDTVEYNE